LPHPTAGSAIASNARVLIAVLFGSIAYLLRRPVASTLCDAILRLRATAWRRFLFADAELGSFSGFLAA
jgi:hypothetical protein